MHFEPFVITNQTLNVAKIPKSPPVIRQNLKFSIFQMTLIFRCGHSIILNYSSIGKLMTKVSVKLFFNESNTLSNKGNANVPRTVKPRVFLNLKHDQTQGL